MNQRARLETAADIADEGCHNCRKGIPVEWDREGDSNKGYLNHLTGRFKVPFLCHSTAARVVISRIAGKDLAEGPTKAWREKKWELSGRLPRNPDESYDDFYDETERTLKMPKPFRCLCGSKRLPTVNFYPDIKGFRAAGGIVECQKCLRATNGKTKAETVAMWNAAMSSSEVWKARELTV